MESGDNAGYSYDVSSYAIKHERMEACTHNIVWHAQAHISAKLGLIRVIKVSMESGKKYWTWVST